LCGRWWWMGIGHDICWDADAAELVVAPLKPESTPWRFTPEGTDRWRGRTGLNAGEILAVRRDEHGTPVELDIATFLFSRDPDAGPH
jgi:hypothetical protein